MGKKHWKKIESENDNFEAHQRDLGLFFIIERFYFYLERRKEKGIVIFDDLEKSIKKTMGELFFESVSKNFKSIFSSLLFSKDDYVNILQVADLIGVSLNSALYEFTKNNKNIKVDELHNNNQYLNIYWRLFEQNSENKSVNGWGLKIWH